MKKFLYSLLTLFLCGTFAAQAQRFAYVDTDSVMHTLPSYAEAQAQIRILRAQFEKEAAYNEQNFQRQFAEFLDGQSTFPEVILQKRQRDLQVSMERGIAFRRDCDRLLQAAEAELLAPIRQRIERTVQQVGMERHYDLILPCRPLFANPAMYEDATPYVISQLLSE